MVNSESSVRCDHQGRITSYNVCYTKLLRILFHLAFPIQDIAVAKRFYVDGLGCTLGRESGRAVTFGLAGHQLVAHVVDLPHESQQGIYPRHFGLVFLSKSQWQALADRANRIGLPFYQQPRVRFPFITKRNLEDFESGLTLTYEHSDDNKKLIGSSYNFV